RERLRARPNIKAGGNQHVEGVAFPYQIAMPDDDNRPRIAAMQKFLRLLRQIELMGVQAREGADLVRVRETAPAPTGFRRRIVLPRRFTPVRHGSAPPVRHRAACLAMPPTQPTGNGRKWTRPHSLGQRPWLARACP